MKLAAQLEVQIKTSERLQEDVDQQISVHEEMFRILGHVLVLLNLKTSDDYQAQFKYLMDELSNSVTKVTVDRVSDKYSSLMIVDIARNVMRIAGSNGLSHESRRREFRMGQGFAGWIWEQKRSDVCDDVVTDDRFHQEGCAPSGQYRSIVGVPVMGVNREVVGALFVQSRRAGVFDRERDPAILLHFARLISICGADYFRRFGETRGETNTPVEKG